MEDFSFSQEVLKQAIASGFAAAVLVLGAWLTFFRSMKENRRKQVQQLEMELEKQQAQRRETFVTETLVNAYRNMHQLMRRESPLFLGHENLREYRMAAEAAIREIQLLADKKNADTARRIGENPTLLQDDAVMQELFVGLRDELRRRLGLPTIEGVPTYMRFLNDDLVLRLDDETLTTLGPHLPAYREMLVAQRAFLESLEAPGPGFKTTEVDDGV